MSELDIEEILGGKRGDIERNLNISDDERHSVCWFCKKIELGAVPHPSWKDFGYVVCEECLAKYENEVSKIDKRKRPELQIFRTVEETFEEEYGEAPEWARDPVINLRFRTPGGFLNWFSKNPAIQLAGTESNEENIIQTIIHEWAHWILFREEGWLTSTQLDNIDPPVFSDF